MGLLLLHHRKLDHHQHLLYSNILIHQTVRYLLRLEYHLICLLRLLFIPDEGPAIMQVAPHRRMGTMLDLQLRPHLLISRRPERTMHIHNKMGTQAHGQQLRPYPYLLKYPWMKLGLNILRRTE
jgi:hypothetical protein